MNTKVALFFIGIQKFTSCFLKQLYEALADQLTDIVVNAVSLASVNSFKVQNQILKLLLSDTSINFNLNLWQVLCIRKPEEAIDLFMVEIMHMRHKFDVDTRLVSLSFMH